MGSHETGSLLVYTSKLSPLLAKKFLRYQFVVSSFLLLAKSLNFYYEEIYKRKVYTKNIGRGTVDPGIDYFDSFNAISSKQKLQQALKSWSNFSVVLFGKRREMRRTTLTNPRNNFNKSM